MLVRIDYTNHRGERRVRKILPLRLHFGASEYHENAFGWYLDAHDMERPEKPIRTFAMTGIHGWERAEREHDVA